MTKYTEYFRNLENINSLSRHYRTYLTHNILKYSGFKLTKAISYLHGIQQLIEIHIFHMKTTYLISAGGTMHTQTHIEQVAPNSRILTRISKSIELQINNQCLHALPMENIQAHRHTHTWSYIGRYINKFERYQIPHFTKSSLSVS